MMLPTCFELVEQGDQAFGRLKGFHGQMGMFVRALSYMLSHGSDGLRHVSGDAVLNANYILAGLKDEMTPAFPGTCMHEALFNDEFLDGTDVTTLDFAKAMIDEGYHPMTMYFPLVVHGALLMEPTETESKDGLDRYIEVVKGLAKRAKAGDAAYFKGAPYHTPRRRLDETLQIEVERVSVKFKTAEGLGPVGEGLSAEAQAVVTLFKADAFTLRP